ncbi:MAG: EamA family transporter [Synergistaceae bacterium]|jgi:transporter family protein|nr:EamA family transporter [Synergistaceae bacterium]
MWVIYAVLSAFFAALTSILAKIGIENVNSNLATAIRTAVILVLAWGIVFAAGKQQEIFSIGQKSWVFLILSGCATGLSWIFYYRALQLGEASKVIVIDKSSVVIGIVLAFIVLHESLDIKTIVGGALITIGTFVLIL